MLELGRPIHGYDADKLQGALLMYHSMEDQNVGTDPMDGNLTVRYTLPPGVAPADPVRFFDNTPDLTCNTVGQEIECSVDATGVASQSQLRWKTLTNVDPSATGTTQSRRRAIR